ncbi:hypothetical protein SPAR3_2208 [Streptococcus pneumoniae GA02714]|nr:hypothetical protein SPAR3_2208 [Streptococcus pneumoniae GA02714]
MFNIANTSQQINVNAYTYFQIKMKKYKKATKKLIFNKKNDIVMLESRL